MVFSLHEILFEAGIKINWVRYWRTRSLITIERSIIVLEEHSKIEKVAVWNRLDKG